MAGRCYVSVSDAALCQRCPALLAYKIHKGRKDAWKVGIKGSKNSYYGSLFHKEIAQVFFEAAANPSSKIHGEIARSFSGGTSSLESVIRERIFVPFLSSKSKHYDSELLLSMAEGIRVWVNAMWEFFADIPSIAENMSTVFIPPEQTLRSCYDCHQGKLYIEGRYDALLFNPDRAEARLFEFKSYMKSDVAVPLSQSLMYSWLVMRQTGITPSVEIIYLGEGHREPVIFSASCVKNMIDTGLPVLFDTVYCVMSGRKVQNFLRDRKLCSVCKFDDTCGNDWRNLR